MESKSPFVKTLASITTAHRVSARSIIAVDNPGYHIGNEPDFSRKIRECLPVPK
jgi:hypothetical protein